MTPDGHALPIIDVTQSRFALPDDPVSNAALFEAYAQTEQRMARTPLFIRSIMLRLAARRSLLVRALIDSDTGFLGGLNTYLMKLGADNLPPPFDSAIDRKLAAAPHVVSMRLRLQQTVALLAEGLKRNLVAAPTAPLWLINIGGGAAADSLNTLILLRHARPECLARPIKILVLDVDAAGPRFGTNALAALQAKDGALAGVKATLHHEVYDWNDTRPLVDLVQQAAAEKVIVAASSEGGLFEYGSDDAIVANLQALHPYARLMVGSVTRADQNRRRSIASGPFKLIPRGLERFGELAKRGGFAIAGNRATPISDQVLLQPNL